PYPRRGPLSAPTPRYIGWGDALNVSRALAPSGGGGGEPAPVLAGSRRLSASGRGKEKARMKQSGAANFRWVWEALASQRGTGGGAPSGNQDEKPAPVLAGRGAAWVGWPSSKYRAPLLAGSGAAGKRKGLNFKCAVRT
ncbi:MAG: hypothetical protein LBC53_06520, partial [Spirochaetaceae bacterium]|nr:hypothetical protein [Spirochaetaceae bacterium]